MPHAYPASVPLVALNLDRAPERWSAFQERNSHVAVRRVVAVDGTQTLSPEDEACFQPGCLYSGGAKGNALSHIRQWREVVNEGVPRVVLEDDAHLRGDFLQQLPRVIPSNPDWDIVMLGWNFDAFVWVNLLPGIAPAKIETWQPHLQQGIARFSAGTDPPTPLRLRHSFGLLGYIVSPKGAKTLLTLVPIAAQVVPFVGLPETIIVENRALDCAMNRVFGSIQAYVSVPPIAVSENRRETSSVPW